MSLDLKPYKGTRDIYPEDMRLRRYIFDTWRSAVEACGYEAYDAAILEPLELYAAKTGEEIVSQQTYTFTDRGDRQVAIRPEMTPSIARMVAARRQELAYPARLYSIANFMRYEKPQRGREREFWQLNADIFGAESIEADVEIIALAAAILERFGARPNMYTIKINDRRLIDFIMSQYLSLDAASALKLIKLLDKKSKIPPADFEAAVAEIVGNDNLSKVQDLLKVESVSKLPKAVLNSGKSDDIKSVCNKLAALGVAAEFDISLMRGFDYYTGIVFEVFDNNPDNNRSMFGGGRYDGLVGLFGVEDLPVVGFAPGETTTIEFLKAWDLLPDLAPATDLVLVQLVDGAEQVAAELRQAGLNVAVDFTGRKLDKVIKSVDKNNLKWILFVGDDELKSGVFKLKNLRTGKEFTAEISQIAEIVLES
ncbi:MAG: histidine--tRNA ligase [Candidatus Nomurabacteria bacterium]|jgi:histidyl-tRNA synthetase|nr:histidine--tRNA ligase [Candidatus Nomurabacteria bacterium]